MVEALAEQGVEVCFTNPGTSEMHFVIALDEASKSGKMRSVLCLFEGVATGAADGYARMSGKPAMSLLHLGHGLANGLSNLHNAKWARVPLINLVGDHARPLQQYNSHPGASHSSPYLGDIEGYAGTVSGWVRRCRTPELAVADALDCLRASFGPDGQARQVSTLIVPADVAWAPASNGQHRLPYTCTNLPNSPQSMPPPLCWRSGDLLAINRWQRIALPVLQRCKGSGMYWVWSRHSSKQTLLATVGAQASRSCQRCLYYFDDGF